MSTTETVTQTEKPTDETAATYVLRLPGGDTVDPLTLTLPGQPTAEQRGQGPFETYPYRHLLPEIFPTAESHQPPLEDFEHVDPGHRALKHPNPRAFLADAKRIFHLTPAIGTEVHGVSLAKLTPDGRDQLALEVARRGMMVCVLWPPPLQTHDLDDRSSAVNKISLTQEVNFGRSLDPTSVIRAVFSAQTWNSRSTGRLHVHPTGGYPKGLPEIHMIYRDQNTIYYESDRNTSIQWHTDMSHERQPPGLT